MAHSSHSRPPFVWPCMAISICALTISATAAAVIFLFECWKLGWIAGPLAIGLESPLLLTPHPSTLTSANHKQPLLVGVGIGDVTGPAGGVNMMGYGHPQQVTHGIHQRLKARAFMFVGSSTIAIVTVDACMMGDAIKRRVLALIPDLGLTDETLTISATHTHSGPGGYLEHVLYQITSFGLVDESLDAIVTGIVDALVTANATLKLTRMYVAEGDVKNAAVNRSPTAYENNPKEERALYDTNVDETMVQLNFWNTTRPYALLNWFPVHLTSMNSSNQLISPDNKGYASWKLEKTRGLLQGLRRAIWYVIFFEVADKRIFLIQGDVSPNVVGARCVDTGEECDAVTSTCGGRSQMCRGLGPGWNVSEIESTRIVGERQVETSLMLLKDVANEMTDGVVESRLMYVDMTNRTVILPTGEIVKTCLPAMGYSFAAGTTDGPGAMDFTQSDNSTHPHPFWNVARAFLVAKPSDAQTLCHHPKPILIDTGEARGPYEWQARIVGVMVMRIGKLVVASVPGEFSTMAGRRLKTRIKERIGRRIKDVKVVVMGPANSYSGYVTTPEEYAIQRYEGASTIYGPYTLNAYMDVFDELVNSLITGSPIQKGTPPEDLISSALRMHPPRAADAVPFGQKFGGVRVNVPAFVRRGETVRVEFWGGHPRNGVEGGTFLAVERMSQGGKWIRVRDDHDWDTKFMWEPVKKFPGMSVVTVEWSVGEDVENGVYRLKYFGRNRNLKGEVAGHFGKSGDFIV
ncbi:ceramidase [Chytridium lagenaria]|nr:ceramidase [Chytridium lagenaria]